MTLTEYGEDLAYETAFWMQGLSNPNIPIAELGSLSLDLSGYFRALAIMALLVKADSRLYRENLIRSGQARETYLKRVMDMKSDDEHHFVSGRYEPLLDVIAADDLELANRVVGLSPAGWCRGREYLDDYCYAQILHGFVRQGPQQPDSLKTLGRFEAFLDGAASARLDVCKALMAGDQAGFDEAFHDLIVEREIRIESDKARGQLEDARVLAHRKIFVEGLAILRLAEVRGIATEREYCYCPSIARAGAGMS